MVLISSANIEFNKTGFFYNVNNKILILDSNNLFCLYSMLLKTKPVWQNVLQNRFLQYSQNTNLWKKVMCDFIPKTGLKNVRLRNIFVHDIVLEIRFNYHLVRTGFHKMGVREAFKSNKRWESGHCPNWPGSLTTLRKLGRISENS